MRKDLAAAVALIVLVSYGPLQDAAGQSSPASPRPDSSVSAETLDDWVSTGITLLLGMQEGDDQAEWPYEGVYRVREAGRPIIPIGYRVGGTGIVASALLHAPGYVEDDARRAAVERAVRFITTSIDHPLMRHDEIPGTYDVRGWGYTYGLQFLLDLARAEMIPNGLTERVRHAIRFFIDGIVATEIPRSGGWNYSRRGGFSEPGATSPFMTAPTLQALFLAVELGHDVDPDIIARGLTSLENARNASGAYVYAGRADNRTQVPGSVARMTASETTLLLAGRGDVSRVRATVDAFIVHWDWLDQRRAQTGTHVAPYGVAPYYFYFGHYYAAQAIEQLPPREREEYRRRLALLLDHVRLEDGSWNDRVFPRSANYGTAMAIMTAIMKDVPAPPTWTAAE